jgi:FkbM family methyltransferase
MVKTALILCSKFVSTRRSYLQHGVCIKPGDWIIDAGANVGMFALFAVQEAIDVKVLAFEPVEPIYNVLCRNCSSAGGKIVPFCIALGRVSAASVDFAYYHDAPGESTRYPTERQHQRHELLAARMKRMKQLEEAQELQQPKETTQHAIEHEAQAAELAMLKGAAPSSEDEPPDVCPSAVTTLATVLRGERDPDEQQCLPSLTDPIALIKVDVEGDELEVLEGISEEDWPRIQQVVVEVTDSPGTYRLQRTVCLLEAKGFSVSSARQEPKWCQGYFMFVPLELQMHYVYATRVATSESTEVTPDIVAAETSTEANSSEAKEVELPNVVCSEAKDREVDLGGDGNNCNKRQRVSLDSADQATGNIQ